MPSAVRPTNVARVTMLMRSNLLLNSIRTNSVDMLKAQNQLSTGLRLSRPSDSPAEATTIMHLDGLLERQSQYLYNIKYAEDFMASTDNALGQAVDLASQAYDLALGSIGTTGDPETNAVILKGIIDQMTTVANQTSRGAYIFGGQNVTQAPFESYQGGVMYQGNLDELQTRVSSENLMNFTVDGNDAFGALSSQVIGTVDLNPDITRDTLLSDLNGTLNRGIRRGSIIISDGTNFDSVDLSGTVTVGDVIDKINDLTPATTTAAISGDGTSITITSTLGGANITVLEKGTGYTARDLGIFNNAGAGATLNGQDVDARLTPLTTIAVLDGGAGIDLTFELKISNSLLPNIDPIDLSGAQTLGDIVNAINNADIGVRAQINDDGWGINVFNQLSGSEMSIGENGGTIATALGIRSMDATTSLADLNGGSGVTTINNLGDQGEIRVTDRDGNTFDVLLGTAVTVQDVINLINTASTSAGANITAGLAAIGNGIELTDTSAGVGDLSVVTISDNGAFIAEQLGLNKTVSANTLTGTNVNPIKPQGLFSHLIALHDAMTMSGSNSTARDAAISAIAEEIDKDRQTLTNYHGMVGSMMQTVEQRKTHMEDNVLSTQTLRSDIRDIDFTEAITRYQNLYTALQANLMTGSELNNISLLDFLR